MMRFTEELRIAAGEQWNRVVNHKFTTELAKGDIDRGVLKRYLIQDHRFLDAFVVLLAATIANARTLDDRIPLCQFLALITGKENTYFERSFVALGCDDVYERMNIPDEKVTSEFVKLMRDTAANGSLGEKLSVLVVAEWSYLTWGENVLSCTKRDGGADFTTYEWVDLHAGEYFKSVIECLRGLLDKEGTLINDEGRVKCKKTFLHVVDLEERFFDMAYNTKTI